MLKNNFLDFILSIGQPYLCLPLPSLSSLPWSPLTPSPSSFPSPLHFPTLPPSCSPHQRPPLCSLFLLFVLLLLHHLFLLIVLPFLLLPSIHLLSFLLFPIILLPSFFFHPPPTPRLPPPYLSSLPPCYRPPPLLFSFPSSSYSASISSLFLSSFSSSPS